MRGLPILLRLQLVWEDLIVPALLLSVLLGLSGVSQAQVTYDDDIFPQVFRDRCNQCHSSTLVGNTARQSAPVGVDYDTFVLATQGTNAVRAVARVAQGTMPPGGALSQTLIDLMVAWQQDGFLELNRPPTVAAGAPQIVNEGTRVELSGTGSDPDGFSVTFNWSQTAGPSVTLTGANTAQASFIAPEVGPNGATLEFALAGTDPGGQSATDGVQITVNNVNRNPMAEAGVDQTVEEGSRVDLNGLNSVDPDGDPLTHNWEQINGPVVTLSDAAAPQPSFMAPLVEATGAVLEFRLTVMDPEGLSGSDTVLINVVDSTAGGVPPRADAGPDQTVAEGALVTLNGSNSSDPDGQVVSFLWTQTAGLVVALSNAMAPQPTFIAPNVPAMGTMLRFELTVTDDDGFVGRDTVMVNVTDTNQPPIADAGPDQTAEGGLILLDGTASNDPENTPLSFLWIQVGGPTVTLSNPMDSQPVFSAPADVSGNLVLVFQLTVTDAGGLAATDTVLVNVTEVNEPPAAIAEIVGPDTALDGSITKLSRVSLSGASSRDTDGTIVTFLWRQTAGPAVTLNNPNSAAIEFFTPDVDAAGAVLEFELTVTDNDGAVATDTVTIMVEDVEEPFAEETQSGDGGCTLNPYAEFDPLLLLLAAVMLVFLGWQRLRRER